MTPTPVWPLVLYFAGVLILVGGMLGLSYLLGQRHKDPATGQPFEAGMAPTGPAHVRLSIKFYLVAVFFVIFDLESAFILTWAVAVRELGWPGYIEVLVFIGVLVAGLVYLWRQGALDWGTLRRKGQRLRSYAASPQDGLPPDETVREDVRGYVSTETTPDLQAVGQAEKVRKG